VKNAATKKPKSEAKLIDQATRNLLKAIKQKMLKSSGRSRCRTTSDTGWTSTTSQLVKRRT
jgi:hypothetical protein